MGILKIRKYGDSILRVRCKPVEKVGEAERKLFENMAEAMYEASGIGLAAPQVGQDKRLIVVDTREGKGLVKLANPEVISREGKDILEEGCLSIPEVTVEVKRAHRVVVCGLNERGEKVEIKGEGLFARALQHEIEHLEGILITDYLSFIQRLKLRPKLLRLKKEGKAIRF